jgi:hypothetical protein
MSIVSGNGSTAAAVLPPRASYRRTARIAGIFVVITFVSIAALPLYDSVLNDTRFIVGGGGDARVELGALAEIITAVPGIGTAVALYPVLRRRARAWRLAMWPCASSSRP